MKKKILYLPVIAFDFVCFFQENMKNFQSLNKLSNCYAKNEFSRCYWHDTVKTSLIQINQLQVVLTCFGYSTQVILSEVLYFKL